MYRQCHAPTAMRAIARRLSAWEEKNDHCIIFCIGISICITCTDISITYICIISIICFSTATVVICCSLTCRHWQPIIMLLLSYAPLAQN